MILRALLLTVLILFSPLALSQTQDLYAFATPNQEQQFNGLLKQLRCLVCQNQDLADSDAKLANDLRRQIYKMVQGGQSSEAIIEHLTQRYGDFILFSPPLNSSTILLWFLPFALLIMALSALFLVVWQRRKVTNLE